MESLILSTSRSIKRFEFICTFEGCKFKDNSFQDMLIHRRTHTNSMPYYCKWKNCKHNSIRKDSIYAHVLRVHLKINQKLFKFVTKEKKEEAHEYIGINEELIEQEKQLVDKKNKITKQFKLKGKNVICDITVYELTAGINFKCVLPKTIAKRFPCDFNGCTSWLSNIDTVLSHRRTHTKSKPFYCTFRCCNKYYSAKGNLMAHIYSAHFKIKIESHILVTPKEKEKALKYVGVIQELLDFEKNEYKENISKKRSTTTTSDDDDDHELVADSDNFAENKNNLSMQQFLATFSDDEDDDELNADVNFKFENKEISSKKRFMPTFSGNDNDKQFGDFNNTKSDYKKNPFKKRRVITHFDDDDNDDMVGALNINNNFKKNGSKKRRVITSFDD